MKIFRDLTPVVSANIYIYNVYVHILICTYRSIIYMYINIQYIVYRHYRMWMSTGIGVIKPYRQSSQIHWVSYFWLAFDPEKLELKFGICSFLSTAQCKPHRCDDFQSLSWMLSVRSKCARKCHINLMIQKHILLLADLSCWCHRCSRHIVTYWQINPAFTFRGQLG